LIGVLQETLPALAHIFYCSKNTGKHNLKPATSRIRISSVKLSYKIINSKIVQKARSFRQKKILNNIASYLEQRSSDYSNAEAHTYQKSINKESHKGMNLCRKNSNTNSATHSKTETYILSQEKASAPLKEFFVENQDQRHAMVNEIMKLIEFNNETLNHHF